MTAPPVLVLGAQRSGTTLLRWCLDAHPAIAIGPETGFLRAVGDVLMAPAIGRDDLPWTDGWSVSEAEVEAAFADAYDRVFRAHAAASGATRWGEKTPVNIAYPHRLARTLPDARLVAIVRHPLGVAASLARWGRAPASSLTYWRASAERLVQHSALAGERFHLVRFEDLLREPAAVLRSVLDHLDEQWDPAVLDPRNADGPSTSDGGNVQRPIDPARAVSWTERVDPAWVRLLPAHEDAMTWFGYRPDLDDPVGTLPAPVFAGVAVPDRPDSVQPPEDRWREHIERTDRQRTATPQRVPSRADGVVGRVLDVTGAVRRRGVDGVVRRLREDLHALGPRRALSRWWRLLRR